MMKSVVGRKETGAVVPQQTESFYKKKKKVNVLYLLPNLQEGINDLEFAIARSHRVYKVCPDATTHKNERLFKGIWGPPPWG